MLKHVCLLDILVAFSQTSMIRKDFRFVAAIEHVFMMKEGLQTWYTPSYLVELQLNEPYQCHITMYSR